MRSSVAGRDPGSPGKGTGAAVKPKKERPGEAFEKSFRDSIPRQVYVRRLRTPTAMGFLVPQLVGLVQSLSARLGTPVPEWVARSARFRFTPKSGFDLLLTVPAPVEPSSFVAGEFKPVEIKTQASLLLACELKSVDGVSIPFDNVDTDQAKALHEAAAAGHLAFLVIEFRKAGEVWALPIQVWQELRLVATRASLPLDEARRTGMQIHADLDRGVSNPYWNIAEWLVRCGGLLPEKAPKGSRKKVPAMPPAPPPSIRSLFD